MNDKIKILVFDEDDELFSLILENNTFSTALEVQKVDHVNDLILALDDFDPHIIVVNENLSSYESLTTLAIAKKRSSELPYILFFDESRKIRTIRKHVREDMQNRFGDTIEIIDSIMRKLEQKGTLQPAKVQDSKDIEFFVGFAVFSDYTFLISTDNIVLKYEKREFVQAPGVDEELTGHHFEDILSLFFDKKKLIELQFEIAMNPFVETELWNGKDDKKAYYSVKAITLNNGMKVISFQDLTHFKLTEEALFSRNKILDVLPDGILLLDLDDQILYASQAVKKLFRFTGKELTGHTFDEVIPVKFTDTSILEMKKTLYEEGTWSGLVFVRDENNQKQEITLRAYLQRSMGDQVTGVILSFEPVTDTNATSTVFGDYRSIVEQIPEGIFILQDGAVIYANEIFCKMLGYVDAEELTASPFQSLIEYSDVETFENGYHQIINYEEVKQELELRFKHKNGINRCYAQVFLTLMQYSSKMTIIGTVRDNTEKKVMEEFLPTQPQNEFNSDNPKRGNEHDLRTYLNAIMGFADIMKEQVTEFPEQSMVTYADLILTNGQKLLKLMEQTAAIAEQTPGQIGVRHESVDVSALAADAIEKNREAALTQNLRLTLVSKTETYAIADKRYLFDALDKILANCVLCSNSGSIIVDCGYDAIKHNVFVRIKDNRPSIPDELLSGLFDPVADILGLQDERLRETNATFAVVKRIMQAMNGKVEVQSSVLKGTTIYIQLPMDKESTEAAAAGSNVYYTISPDVIYLNELHPYILIIEDDPGSSKMLEITLRNVAKLDIAANGKDALSIIGSNHEQGIIFDLVLIDIGLPPPWNGITLSQHIIKTYEGYELVPFIAETAFALKNDREKILAAGFAGFMSKPIDRRYLIKTIASIIRKKRGDEEPKYETYSE